MSEGGSGEGGRKVGGAVQKVGQRWRRHCVTLGRSVDREALQPRESKVRYEREGKWGKRVGGGGRSTRLVLVSSSPRVWNLFRDD